MVRKGMLWALEKNQKGTIKREEAQAQIVGAIKYYVEKYGHKPDGVSVHPILFTLLNEEESEGKIASNTQFDNAITLFQDSSVHHPHVVFIGME